VASGDSLALRLLSAAILIPLVVAVVVIGAWTFWTLIAAAVVLMAVEWAGLIGARFGRPAGRFAGAVVALVVAVASLLFALGWRGEALAWLLLGAACSSLLARRFDAPSGWTTVGIVYVGLPTLALLWLRSLPELGLWALLWLLVVVWATDTAAYAAGRLLGGPRLAPAISPAKTWSGLIGGMLGAALVAMATTWIIGSTRLAQAAGLGAALAVVAQLGDLFESALKRRAGIKDSGRSIPGHGGLLDRVDGLLFAAPALAAFGLLLGPEALPWR
jgi:phosphatidate cytidylyltransferase